MPNAPRRLTVLPAAEADIQRIGQDDPRLALQALARIDLLRAGRLEGKPLRDMASTGDLRDCRKIYFAGTRDEKPTHRLVYRVTGHDADGREEIEVVDVVAVEARDEAYVYLLAAKRLGVLPRESEPRFNRLHQQVIAQRAAARKAKGAEG
jgi:hypothetical protein